MSKKIKKQFIGWATPDWYKSIRTNYICSEIGYEFSSTQKCNMDKMAITYKEEYPELYKNYLKSKKKKIKITIEEL